MNEDEEHRPHILVIDDEANMRHMLETMLTRAQAFASQIVGRRGATVDDSSFYRPFIDSWKLENH